MISSREILRPTIHIESFADLPVVELAEEFHIRAISVDIDQTLLGQHEEKLPDEHLDKISEIGAYGLSLIGLSNAHEDHRVARLGRLRGHILEATRVDLTVLASQQAGYRKPHPILFRLGAEVARERPVHMCHVGDQVSRDVVGANLAGYGATVLTNPYGEGGNTFVNNVQRPLEEEALKRRRPLYIVRGGQLLKGRRIS